MAVKVSATLSAEKLEETPSDQHEEIIEQRRRMFARADELSGQQLNLSEVKPSSESHEAQEDIETIEVELPNGHVVVFGPPSGISMTMRIALMFGAENPNRLTTTMMRTLFCVRSVDGRSVSPISNTVEAQALANILGDDGCDLLFDLLMATWPPPTTKSLKIIRKSARHQKSAS